MTRSFARALVIACVVAAGPGCKNAGEGLLVLSVDSPTMRVTGIDTLRVTVLTGATASPRQPALTYRPQDAGDLTLSSHAITLGVKLPGDIGSVKVLVEAFAVGGTAPVASGTSPTVLVKAGAEVTTIVDLAPGSPPDAGTGSDGPADAGDGPVGPVSGAGGQGGGQATGGVSGAGGQGGGQATGGVSGAGGQGGTVAACSSTQHLCGGNCVSNNDVAHCGSRCDACGTPAGATATCNGSSCDFTCGTLKKCVAAGICVAADGCCTNSDCPAMGSKVGACDTGTHMCNYTCGGANPQACTANGITSCIATGGCCQDSDCPGSCQSCSASHTCVAALNQADPNGRCPGTCDASGVCKSKRGQTCATTAAGCVGGATCSPDGMCCDTACTSSCLACDLTGLEGTCSPVPSGAPHGSRTACGGAGVCAASCGGRTDGACVFPTVTCGAGPTCSGTQLVPQGTCSAGACSTPAAAPCAGNIMCSANACKASCSANSDCLSGYYCQSPACHLAAKHIAAGGASTCALLSDGTARCWGYNSAGQLGDGLMTNTATPTPVQGLSGATAITLADLHGCAVLATGAVKCWGQDQFGDLGDGMMTTTNALVPVSVVGGAFGATTMISAGGGAGPPGNDTCVVLTGGTVDCWGYNQSGQLGNNTTTNSASPVAVTGLTGATMVAAGSYHTCALVAGGAIKCWGEDGFGQLGDGTTTNSLVPVTVAGISGAISVKSGQVHACALLGAGGTVKCWGANANGEVGNGTIIDTSTPTPVTVTGVSGATALAAGYRTTCALVAGGAVKCWGDGSNGQLGNGGMVDSGTAVDVTGLSGAIEIAVGNGHACALLGDGSMTCWGLNLYGELGSNATIRQTTPVAVTGW